ncbi:MAG TPA: ABC transporter ATP-binding protein [Solirubrobacteraceae bacterium]|nr:ABC transporter ATP-binding protein [Solirubrobacteraceae bacterium]
MLELRELCKRYPIDGIEWVDAVDHVSLTLLPGEFLAMYGPSGSGKSTLLLLTAAIITPDEGAVIVDGREISRLAPRAAAGYRLRELGFIRQSLDLIPGADALDNAAIKLLGAGLTARQARRRVAPLLERLGMGHRLSHRADTLSMGERQRVMIARALSTDPKLVLADEPTGNLDSRSGAEVLALLAELCAEREAAVLLATHDPQAAGFADRVSTLRDGQLTERPPPSVPVVVAASQ